jgi:hypothetical protein
MYEGLLACDDSHTFNALVTVQNVLLIAFRFYNSYAINDAPRVAQDAGVKILVGLTINASPDILQTTHTAEPCCCEWIGGRGVIEKLRDRRNFALPR